MLASASQVPRSSRAADGSGNVADRDGLEAGVRRVPSILGQLPLVSSLELSPALASPMIPSSKGCVAMGPTSSRSTPLNEECGSSRPRFSPTAQTAPSHIAPKRPCCRIHSPCTPLARRQPARGLAITRGPTRGTGAWRMGRDDMPPLKLKALGSQGPPSQEGSTPDWADASSPTYPRSMVPAGRGNAVAEAPTVAHKENRRPCIRSYDFSTCQEALVLEAMADKESHEESSACGEEEFSFPIHSLRRSRGTGDTARGVSI
ncbi:hypothetical protein G7046_g4072 [Stylonectria norvegica]|nr:hypothetical protein G7046_g4072 [Stylonectria norvegica]